VAGAVDGADIERRVEHRRLEVRELVEDPDDEYAVISRMLTIGKRRGGMPSVSGVRQACVFRG
jgi:hypothetical protein